MYRSEGSTVVCIHPELETVELFLTVHPTADCTMTTEEQAKVLADLLNKRDALRAELTEIEQLFDSMRAADEQAIKRWQEAHPDRPDVRPGRGDVVIWLMEQLDETNRLLAWTYQAVGVMLFDLGQFGTERGNKLLDNLSKGRIVHDDILPWPSFERPATDAAHPPHDDGVAMLAIQVAQQRIAELINERDNLIVDKAALAMIHDVVKSPDAVHMNMLRGTIAKPSVENILHLYPELRRANSE